MARFSRALRAGFVAERPLALPAHRTPGLSRREERKLDRRHEIRGGSQRAVDQYESAVRRRDASERPGPLQAGVQYAGRTRPKETTMSAARDPRGRGQRRDHADAEPRGPAGTQGARRGRARLLRGRRGDRAHAHRTSPRCRRPRARRSTSRPTARCSRERPDALLYPTVAPGRTIEERYGHTALLAEAGAIRCGALDTGSVNLGAALPDGWPMPMDYVYTNSPNDIRYMAEVCRAHRLGPSVAVFEPGFLRVVLAAEKRGALPPGTLREALLQRGRLPRRRRADLRRAADPRGARPVSRACCAARSCPGRWR